MEQDFNQLLEELLKTDNSILPLVLRLGLSGLRTQLDEALNLYAEDPGKSVCQELIDKLNLFLESHPLDGAPEKISPVFPSSRPEGSPEDKENLPPGSGQESINLDDYFEPVPECKLMHIGEALSQGLSNYIGPQYQFKSTNDADLWNEMQCMLLRVPEREANTWREQIWQQVNEIGALENKRSRRALPFTRNENLYSGLKGSIEASGWRLSKQPNFDGELGFLDGVVSTYLKFIDKLDSSNLYHALGSIDLFDVKSLKSEEEKVKYKTALTKRFQYLLQKQKKVDADPVSALRTALDLDEAINSLIYVPLVDRYSWWGKLQQEARDKLEYWVEKVRHAGYDVQIRYLWGTYADVYKEKLSKNDLELDIGGVPGDVSACLRVYAKIKDEVLPGRVIWHPS